MTNGKKHFYMAALVLLFGTATCSASKAESAAPATVQVALNSLKIAILLDKTGSANVTRTQQPEPKDFDPLIDLLLKTGGELGVGVIRDQGNRSLLRLRIEVPPAKPTELPPERNPFKEAERRARYQSQIADYEKQYQQWFTKVGELRKVFMGALVTLTSQKADAPNTDLYSAVERAELFLCEPDITWPCPTHRYLVLVSDGQDNVQKKPIVVRSGAKVIVANGSGSLGALTHLNPEQFESLEAAFRFIVAKEAQDAR